MPTILETIQKPIKAFPRAVKSTFEKITTSPQKIQDKVSGNISRLNSLNKQLTMSEEFVKGWQSRVQDSLVVGDVRVPRPEGHQAPVQRKEILNNPNHSSHESRKNFGCDDAFNCHAYAVGQRSENPYEANLVKKAGVTPESRSHTSWNHYPANELRENYFQLRPGQRTQVGDVLIYGIDHNKNGKIDDLYQNSNGVLVPEIAHSAVVVKIQEGKPVLCESKRGDEAAIASHGPDTYLGIGEHYGYRMGTFRLKPGVDPERIWKK